MNRRPTSRAFTLIELLIVVAIIALLISIILPGLQGAREAAKRAKCLAHLKNIATGTAAYSGEDAAEHAVPIHISMVSQRGAVGWTTQHWWRTASVFSFGGQTPTIPFLSPTPVTVMLDPNNPVNVWHAGTRPLNRYLFPDLGKGDQGFELFKCPSDSGYPDSEWVAENLDQPNRNSAERECFEMLGNSYRINVAGVVFASEPPTALCRGNFTVGSWGHRASSLTNTSRLVLYSEPLFYNMSRPDFNRDGSLWALRGWHRRKMTDNVAYVDGSARATHVDTMPKFDEETLAEMNVAPGFRSYSSGGYTPDYFLRRGLTWQTDAYPTPGALIRMHNTAGQDVTPSMQGYFQSDLSAWPFTGYQDNARD